MSRARSRSGPVSAMSDEQKTRLQAINELIEDETNPNNPPELQQGTKIFGALLHGRITPEAAAKQLTRAWEPVIIRGEENHHGSEIWDMVVTAACELGNYEDISERLVILLECIEQQPEILVAQGNPIIDEFSSLPWWNCFAIYHRVDYVHEELPYERRPRMGIPVLEEKYLEQADAYRNAHIFCAVSFNCGNSRMAAEHAVEGFLEFTESKFADVQGLKPCGNVLLPPCAEWIRLSGDRLYHICQHHDDFYGYRHWITMEQWALWKAKFARVGADADFDKDLRKIARRAVKNMQKIEDAGSVACENKATCWAEKRHDRYIEQRVAMKGRRLSSLLVPPAPPQAVNASEAETHRVVQQTGFVQAPWSFVRAAWDQLRCVCS